MPIVVIVFVVEKCVWARGDCLRCARHSFLFKSFISRCMACLLSCLWDMASAGLCGVYAPFPKHSILFVPTMLRVWEITLLLGSGWLRLMGACPVGV